MAKRKKKKAKAPVKALRKKAKSIPGGAHKIKPTGKRKAKRAAVAEPVADPIKGKFLIEKEGGFLLKLNNLGEQEFSTAGEPSEFSVFPNKEAANEVALTFTEGAPSVVVPFGKYFGVNHRIDTDENPPKLITSLAWLSTNPVPLKAAVKTALETLKKIAKERVEEAKAYLRETAIERKNRESEIKDLQKDLAAFDKDVVKELAMHEEGQAECEEAVDNLRRRFK